MTARLQLEIFDNWTEEENTDGPATFKRVNSSCPGTFQVSIAGLYKSGEVPNPSHADLVEMCEGMAMEYEGEVHEKQSGDCKFGRFGSVIFSTPDLPRVQVWLLSNSRDFLTATHICDANPDSNEIDEVSHMVSGLGLNYIKDPWWKFW